MIVVARRRSKTYQCCTFAGYYYLKWIFNTDSISMIFDEIIMVVHVNIHAEAVLVMG